MLLKKIKNKLIFKYIKNFLGINIKSLNLKINKREEVLVFLGQKSNVLGCFLNLYKTKKKLLLEEKNEEKVIKLLSQLNKISSIKLFLENPAGDKIDYFLEKNQIKSYIIERGFLEYFNLSLITNNFASFILNEYEPCKKYDLGKFLNDKLLQKNDKLDEILQRKAQYSYEIIDQISNKDFLELDRKSTEILKLLKEHNSKNSILVLGESDEFIKKLSIDHPKKVIFYYQPCLKITNNSININNKYHIIPKDIPLIECLKYFDNNIYTTSITLAFLSLIYGSKVNILGDDSKILEKKETDNLKYFAKVFLLNHKYINLKDNSFLSIDEVSNLLISMKSEEIKKRKCNEINEVKGKAPEYESDVFNTKLLNGYKRISEINPFDYYSIYCIAKIEAKNKKNINKAINLFQKSLRLKYLSYKFQLIIDVIEDPKNSEKKSYYIKKYIPYYDPISLLHPHRMDIVVKYLFAKSLLYNNTINYDYYKKLYSKHIQKRTNGNEAILMWNPNTNLNTKNHLENYVTDFKNLITSFNKYNFKEDKWIPVSQDSNSILDGAHRLSLSILYNQKIPALRIENFNALKWDINWFRNNKFDEEQCNNIIKEYLKLRTDSRIVVIWPPLKSQLSEIEVIIRKRLNIVDKKEIKLDGLNSLNNLIYEIYYTQFGLEVDLKPKISKKGKYMMEFGNIVTFYICSPKSYGNSDSFKITKEEIRKKYHDKVSRDLFISCHITDDDSDTSYLANILYNTNYLKHVINYYKIKRENKFTKQLIEYDDSLKKHNIDKNKSVVIGSAVLVALGIKNNCEDIDIIIDQDLRKERNFAMDKVISLSNEVEIVKSNYHSRSGKKNTISDNELINSIDNHFIHRGFKFINLHILADNKSLQKRPRDKIQYKIIYDCIRDGRHNKVSLKD